MKILALMPDSYGGKGGIAQYYRDLFDALCQAREVESILSLSRHKPAAAATLPEKLTEEAVPGNPLRYCAKALRRTLAYRPDVILCGHMNLVVAAAALKRVTGGTLALQVHGVEAWRAGGGRGRAWGVGQADWVLAVSRFTRERILGWSGLEPHKVKVLPNTIRLSDYRVGRKPPNLVARYGLDDRRVLLTFGRLSGSERYKGHDRIISLMPQLLRRVPDLVYVIVGGGDDRARLEQLADRHGVLPRVLFTGEVPGHEKIDHYHLADAFAMPSTGEGFGIVFLEAAACGLPVLGGATDASRDPLRDGEMGVLVDPADPALLLEGLCQILSRERRVPESLRDFDFTNFEQQVCALFGAMSRSEDALVK